MRTHLVLPTRKQAPPGWGGCTVYDVPAYFTRPRAPKQHSVLELRPALRCAQGWRARVCNGSAAVRSWQSVVCCALVCARMRRSRRHAVGVGEHARVQRGRRGSAHRRYVFSTEATRAALTRAFPQIPLVRRKKAFARRLSADFRVCVRCFAKRRGV